MATLFRDLRFAVRLLRQSPAFTLIAVGALALGIGANTAVFSVVNGLLLEPLPYRAPDRLVAVWEENVVRGEKQNVVSPANFIHWREMNRVFAGMAGTSPAFRTTLTGAGDPIELPFQYMSANLLQVVGVAPELGRAFTADEERPGADKVALLSDGLWRRRFGADPNVLNRSIQLDGESCAIVGVMPPGFSILDQDRAFSVAGGSIDVWRPLALPPEARTPHGRWMEVVARLKPGISLASAQADMTRVHAELTRLYPAFNTGWTAEVVSMRDQLSGGARPALLILLGAVGFVLLIACANVANLLLARATARQREVAVRAALGAGRRRLAGQLLAESLLLSLTGGAAGVLLAWWAVRSARASLGAHLPVPRLAEVAVDGRVLLFALALAVLSGVVFGIVPAFTAARGNLVEALKEGGRTGSGARGARTRSAFVVVEMALALVLLVGAGLLVRSFMALVRVDPGFDPSHTVTMKLSLPQARYRDNAAVIGFFDRLFDRIDALPGVRASGGTSFLPLNGMGAATSFEIVGRPAPPAGDEPVADVRVVTRDYFKAMGVRLVRGRFFDARDAGAQRHRVIINETMARTYWPGEDPIGRQVVISWNDKAPDEIIGVVADVRQASLETAPRSTTYWPPARFAYPWNVIAIRTSGDPMHVAPDVIAIVHQLDADLPVSDIQTMDDVLSASTAERRVTMTLLAGFAGLALLLAGIGIYGVISYSVQQRTQEIGIRMALGAPRAAVLSMVIRQALVLAGAGILAGAAGALMLTRVMRTLLFGVTPSDGATFGAVALLLIVVAALASAIPGLRATHVDPIVALRSE
ncbi:MAG TPA: ABC transporter permease [Vicinamibacterales bacterium]|nr:ABC transporter permease [Vicinamibacterales bacterium]